MVRQLAGGLFHFQRQNSFIPWIVGWICPKASLKLSRASFVFVGALASAILAPLSPSAAQKLPCGVPQSNIDAWPIDNSNLDFSSEHSCALFDELTNSEINIHSVLVVRSGKLAFEYYHSGPDEKWGRPLGQTNQSPTVKHDVRSITKSVVSLLVGIAIDHNLIRSIDEPVFNFFPEYASLRTPAKDRILVRHLLTMSSGIAWDENRPYTDPQNSERRMIAASDPYAYVLEQPLATEPGDAWNYSGGSVALLGAILQKVTHKTLADFAGEVLFAPLEITDFEWIKMPNGEYSAASGLRLRPRDMAKIGQLVLSGGIWNSESIVSPGWLKQSTEWKFRTQTRDYGFLWWVGSSRVNKIQVGWLEAFGLGGQRIIIVPSLDLIVVFTTGLYGTKGTLRDTNNIMNAYILPAILLPSR